MDSSFLYAFYNKDEIHIESFNRDDRNISTENSKEVLSAKTKTKYKVLMQREAFFAFPIFIVKKKNELR